MNQNNIIIYIIVFSQKKYKRLKKLKPIDSDEEDDDRASIGGHSADEREALAHELFEDDEETEQVVVRINSENYHVKFLLCVFFFNLGFLIFFSLETEASSRGNRQICWNR